LIRKIAALLAVGLALGAFLGAIVLFSTTSSNKGPRIGQALENFKLAQLQGASLQLADLKGKPVIVNFWATWCIPCQDEMPLLENYSRKLSNSLIVIGVNSQEQPDVVQDFVTKYRITFPIALDSNGNLTRSYLINGFPTTFFVDKNGILRNMHIGVLREDIITGYLQSIEVNP
jgi:cytochrome c biogenesis protein CcmG/thiol:disulfide interchange protein DsbE